MGCDEDDEISSDTDSVSLTSLIFKEEIPLVKQVEDSFCFDMWVSINLKKRIFL